MIVDIVIQLVVIAIGLVLFFHLPTITDHVHLGSVPTWNGVIYALTITTVAFTSLESATGLSDEITVSRAGVRRIAWGALATLIVIYVGMAAVAVTAVPVMDGRSALATGHLGAPVIGIVERFHPGALADTFKYIVAAAAGVTLIVAADAAMLGLSRLAFSLATNRQIPSGLGRLHPRRATPFVLIGIAAASAAALVIPGDLDFLVGIFAFGAMLAFTIAHLVDLRAALPRAGPAAAVPDPGRDPPARRRAAGPGGARRPPLRRRLDHGDRPARRRSLRRPRVARGQRRALPCVPQARGAAGAGTRDRPRAGAAHGARARLRLDPRAADRRRTRRGPDPDRGAARQRRAGRDGDRHGHDRGGVDLSGADVAAARCAAARGSARGRARRARAREARRRGIHRRRGRDRDGALAPDRRGDRRGGTPARRRGDRARRRRGLAHARRLGARRSHAGRRELGVGDGPLRRRARAVPRDPDRSREAATRRRCPRPRSTSSIRPRVRVDRRSGAGGFRDSQAGARSRTSGLGARRGPALARAAGRDRGAELGGRRRPVHGRDGARGRRPAGGGRAARRRVHRLDRRRQHQPHRLADRAAAVRRREGALPRDGPGARRLVRRAGPQHDLADAARDRAVRAGARVSISACT